MLQLWYKCLLCDMRLITREYGTTLKVSYHSLGGIFCKVLFIYCTIRYFPAMSYGKMMIHIAHTLYVRCHAPVTYSKPYRLYGVLWRPGGHKRTKSFLTLYYRPKLSFYDQNMKATSSYFILKQSLSPPMKHKYRLFLSKLRTLWIYPHI